MTQLPCDVPVDSPAEAAASVGLSASDAVIATAPGKDSLGRVTRQSLVNMAGGLVAQGLKFLVLILIARQFSPTGFGEFSFAWAVYSFIYIVANFGLPTFGARRVSQDGAIGSRFALEMALCRAGLALAGTLLAVLFVLVQPHTTKAEVWLVGLLGASTAAQAGLFDWAFQGLGRLDISALLNISWQALWLIFTRIGLSLGAGLEFVGAALLLTALVTSGFSYLLLRRYWSRETIPQAKAMVNRCRQLFQSGATLGTATVVITVLVWSDTIIVRLFRGEQAVAFYAAGNRAALALAMLASLYVQGAFPSMTQAASRSRSDFDRYFQQSYEDLALYFLPGALWAVCYAPEIILLLFQRPEYLAAVPVFRMFQITFLLTASWNLCGMGLFVAFHRDREYQNILLATAAMGVPLCVLLTAWFDITATSAAVLASQALCLALFCWKGRSVLNVRHRTALLWPFTAGIGVSLLGRSLGWGLAGSGAVLAAAYAALLLARYRSMLQIC
jgi:O-antigen/teichoic acid export membrane protein